jgi:hypothetical protein
MPVGGLGHSTSFTAPAKRHRSSNGHAPARTARSRCRHSSSGRDRDTTTALPRQSGQAALSPRSSPEAPSPRDHARRRPHCRRSRNPPQLVRTGCSPRLSLERQHPARRSPTLSPPGASGGSVASAVASERQENRRGWPSRRLVGPPRSWSETSGEIARVSRSSVTSRHTFGFHATWAILPNTPDPALSTYLSSAARGGAGPPPVRRVARARGGFVQLTGRGRGRAKDPPSAATLHSSRRHARGGSTSRSSPTPMLTAGRSCWRRCATRLGAVAVPARRAGRGEGLRRRALPALCLARGRRAGRRTVLHQSTSAQSEPQRRRESSSSGPHTTSRPATRSCSADHPASAQPELIELLDNSLSCARSAQRYHRAPNHQLTAADSRTRTLHGPTSGAACGSPGRAHRPLSSRGPRRACIAAFGRRARLASSVYLRTETARLLGAVRRGRADG